MPNIVSPVVHLVGYTVLDPAGLRAYLEETGNEEFIAEWDRAKREGLSDGEILTSFYAKVCYASLSLGHNQNLSRVRDVRNNLIGTIDSAHFSVWEHVNLNFIVTNCSRVYTHEQCRHRAGWAYSQTSGRYVRGDVINFVHDPILDVVKDEGLALLSSTESIYKMMCDRACINGYAAFCESFPGLHPDKLREMWEVRARAIGFDPDGQMPFDVKKALTSALRRFLPNGQANEMGMTANLRSLRHVVQLRTHPAAEWEIRQIYAQIYDICKSKWPMLFFGAKERYVNGAVQVYGMRMQPYEQGESEVLKECSLDDLKAELARREQLPDWAS